MTVLLHRTLFSPLAFLPEANNSFRLRPYTTRPYTLLIGASRVQYTVLEDYLRFVPKWSEKCNFQANPLPIIDLTADVHEDAGHTLVHFLNTGAYQTLKLPGISGIGQKLADYKTSVLAYCVAKNHGLPVLETLAKHHVTTSGEKLPFFDLLDITATVYGELPAGEQWFVTFLKNTIDAAFKSDRDLFRKDAFLNRIGDNRSFNLVLVNSIVRNLAKSNETTFKHPEPQFQKSSRGWARDFDFQDTPVELVMPVAGQEDPAAAKEERRAPEAKSVFAENEPVANKEDPFFAKSKSSSVEERGRSPGPRASSISHPDTPSSHQSEGISCGETAHTQPVDARPKDDRTSMDDDWAVPAFSSKYVLPKVKKFKKTIKKKTSEDLEPALPEVDPVTVVEPGIGFVDEPAEVNSEDWNNWTYGIPARSLKKDKKKGKKGPEVLQSLPPPPESCLFSNEHLQTEGWKNCVPCRARVQQLGLQLKQDEALNETF